MTDVSPASKALLGTGIISVFDDAMLAQALNSTICGITVVDAQLPDMPLVYCNPAFTTMTGYRASEALGKNCRFLQGSDTDPAAVEAIRSAIRHARQVKVVLKNYRKDGRAFWNELILSPVVDDHGELTHYIGVQNDITAQRQAEDALKDLNRELDERVFARTRELMSALQAVSETREQALSVVGLALEYRDYETKGHTERVTRNAVSLGRRLKLDERALHDLRWGSFLHDAGKIAIPDDLLLKPRRLMKDEFDLMKQHVLIGEAMLKHLSFLPPSVLGLVRHHHERWDGSGYPDGLAGERIPLLARLFSVVDVYDALISKRPYKEAWLPAAAVAELRRQSGRQFDPNIVEAFLAQLDEQTNS